jgi:rod shape determining protein RodA
VGAMSGSLANRPVGTRPRTVPPPSEGLLGRDSKLRRSDWILWAAVLSLCLLGTLLVAAATKHSHPTHPFADAEKQVLFIAVGVVLAVLASLADYRAMRSGAPVIYVLGLLGLLATFVIGSDVNGAKSWINIGGGLSIEPAEFSKLAIIVLVAMLFNAKVRERQPVGDADVVRALVIMAVPMGLILMQNDLGTTLVLIAIMFGVLAVGAAPARWIAGLSLAMVVGAIVVVKLHILHGYQMGRLTSFLNPDADLAGTGYNAYQARIAIGTGGLTGSGLFHGQQINSGAVFASSTDFIFATAGEELGFLGGAAIIGLIAIIMWRGLRIAAHAPDLFGRVVAAGVVCWFAFQSFENIGMNLGIMPVTGIPLLFVSYGGSSMFASMLAIGLLQNVHIQTKAGSNSTPV